ncbi:MAG: translocation/assembly module TamB domain-containing protein [Herminiimonas sp.]|nr:translocation/assembly module TamB domain-containing protein [Herminiimonas sp.]
MFALLMLSLAALTAWLLATEHGAGTALSTVVRNIGPGLRIEGVHGRLAGPLQIDRISVENAQQRLVLENLRLEWQPAELLQRRLHINALRVGRLLVVRKIEQASPAAQLPASLALPLALQIDSAQVDGGGVSLGALEVASFAGFGLALDYDRVRYHLRLDRFGLKMVNSLVDPKTAAAFGAEVAALTAAPAAPAPAASQIDSSLHGELTLADRRPFALTAKFSSETSTRLQGQDVRSAGEFKLNGSLEQLSADLDLNVNQNRATANAVLRPFAPQPLVSAQLRSDGLNLSALRADLPVTSLDIDLRANDGAGSLTLTNSAAGFHSVGKLALASLSTRFRQGDGKIEFDAIQAVLGTAQAPAGRVAGSGTYGSGAVNLKLAVSDVDLRRIEPGLRSTRLAGELVLTHAAGRQDLNLELREPLATPAHASAPLTLSAHASLADSSLSIDHARLRLGEAQVDATAAVALTGTQGFLAEGSVQRFHLQALGNFSGVPDLLLNGKFSVQGTRAPHPTGELTFTLTDSSLGGQPLRGAGNATLKADRIDIPSFLLVAGANQIDIHGALAERASRLQFEVKAPQLTQLGPAFAGAGNASGTIEGTLDRARLQARWQFDQLRTPGALQVAATSGQADVAIDRRQPWMIGQANVDATARAIVAGDNKVATATLRLRAGPQAQAPLLIEAKADGVQAPGIQTATVDLGVHGTTARHAVALSLTEPGQRWQLGAAGGLSHLPAAPEWLGRIEQVEASGRWRAKLQDPAALQVSVQRVQLDHFAFDSDTALVRIAQFKRDAGGVSTSGHVERLQVAPLLRFATATPAFSTDLQLRGDWNLQVGERVTGSVDLLRERGDIIMQGAAPVALGLSNLHAQATAASGGVRVQVQAAGRQLGQLDGDVSTVLQKTASGFVVTSNAPLSGRVRFDSASLAWVGPLVSPTAVMAGQLQSAVTIAGTRGTPKLSGKISGNNLRILLTDLGLDLHHGVLDSDFSDDRLMINKLSFGPAPGPFGQMALSGPIGFANGQPSAQLAIVANHFVMFERADRRLIVSGDSAIAFSQGKASVTGKFRADRGDFDIGRPDRPSLSSDVVVGKREEAGAASRSLSLDVGINLGDGITIHGRGLDAQLIGDLRFTSNTAEGLRARGTLRVDKGSFTAYGRALAIEQGLLRFDGAVNNPALDILAMRRGTTVEAGVSVRGTVLAPRIALVSEPSVPDAEKLSWMVLGRGLDAVAGGDLGTLQSAAASLLSQGAASGVQSHIATAFGLDDFKLGTNPDNLQQRIVTLGKQISSRLYVSFEQALQTTSSVIHLRYTLSKKLTIEAEAGARSALSLFYNVTFD